MTSIYKKETVETIQEIKHIKYENEWKEGYVGIQLTTTKQKMAFLIDDYKSCCEEYGVELVDTPRLGSEIIDITWKDEKNFFYDTEIKLYAIKLKFQTSGGDFYIRIYNNHNGYYKHSYSVILDDYKNEGEL